MEYYAVNCKLTDPGFTESNSQLKINRDFARKINQRTSAYNSAQKDATCCFVHNIDENDVSVGIITSRQIDVKASAEKYLAAIGLPTEICDHNEIIFKNMLTMLRETCRNGYYKDEDEVLENLGIESLNSSWFKISTDEKLLDENVPKERSFLKSSESTMDETLHPELERVFAGSLKKLKGHPVHYYVESDDSDIARAACTVLLEALYAMGRIENRRCTFFDVCAINDLSESNTNELYKSCAGGTIVLDATELHESAECSVNGDIETLSTACKVAAKYRNDVLTLICLPLSFSSKLIKLLDDELASMSFVTVKEKPVEPERARVMLRRMARKNGTRGDKKLDARISDSGSYTQSELKALFDGWFTEKLRAAYPAYCDSFSEYEENKKTARVCNAYNELSEMIGLKQAKTTINKALDYYKLIRRCANLGINGERPAMHMIFTGNPGTAKTTVARLFASIMKDNGLVESGQLIEVGRSDLVGKYVGWTAKIVKEKFRKARGGVLFIDEAYSLADGHEGSYGDEAINTIVQEMENERDNVIVIFAGYPDKMDDFLSRNPGLRSRIAFHVRFDDYDADDLCEITRLIGKKQGVFFTSAAIERLRAGFNLISGVDDFGNGRYARNVVELSRMNLATRLVRRDVNTLTKEEVTTIEAQDVEMPSVNHKDNYRRIGFVA